MSFELAWNMVKDYLQEQGFIDIKSPRGALKRAFEMGIIENGHHWMDLLLDRNLTAHNLRRTKGNRYGIVDTKQILSIIERITQNV